MTLRLVSESLIRPQLALTEPVGNLLRVTNKDAIVRAVGRARADESYGLTDGVPALGVTWLTDSSDVLPGSVERDSLLRVSRT
jgi:hypothetical protein